MLNACPLLPPFLPPPYLPSSLPFSPSLPPSPSPSLSPQSFKAGWSAPIDDMGAKGVAMADLADGWNDYYVPAAAVSDKNLLRIILEQVRGGGGPTGACGECGATYGRWKRWDGHAHIPP